MELLTHFNEYAASHEFDDEEVIKLGIDICRALELCSNKNLSIEILSLRIFLWPILVISNQVILG